MPTELADRLASLEDMAYGIGGWKQRIWSKLYGGFRGIVQGSLSHWTWNCWCCGHGMRGGGVCHLPGQGRAADWVAAGSMDGEFLEGTQYTLLAADYISATPSEFREDE
ncbi:hypothetical protein AM231_08690 [Paenibacillus solani]|uniref:Uncharacterized protein n=1 Tax=Paenibacillus solani TaxID=1705565 RepID=A0A0M1P4I5_9BACL|nr:hypothetical protein AM231_08690 [Paenibacillus solani]